MCLKFGKKREQITSTFRLEISKQLIEITMTYISFKNLPTKECPQHCKTYRL